MANEHRPGVSASGGQSVDGASDAPIGDGEADRFDAWVQALRRRWAEGGCAAPSPETQKLEAWWALFEAFDPGAVLDGLPANPEATAQLREGTRAGLLGCRPASLAEFCRKARAVCAVGAFAAVRRRFPEPSGQAVAEFTAAMERLHRVDDPIILLAFFTSLWPEWLDGLPAGAAATIDAELILDSVEDAGPTFSLDSDVVRLDGLAASLARDVALLADVKSFGADADNS